MHRRHLKIAAHAQRPFRWNIARREQLGLLIEGEEPPVSPEFLAQLRTAAAQIVARAGDSDLVFVGRSPENIFDYLSGIFDGVPAPPSLTLLQFSSPGSDIETLTRSRRREFDALLGYFAGERLDPLAIASYGKPVRFIDCVASGMTFASLYACLRYWSDVQGADWNVVRRRIGFVGITSRAKSSPKTWRWHQHQDWTAELRKSQISNVAIPAELWGRIANSGIKVSPSHRLQRWASPRAAQPNYKEDHLKALRLAVRLFELGRDKRERQSFVRELAAQREMTAAWLRALASRLRRSSPGR